MTDTNKDLHISKEEIDEAYAILNISKAKEEPENKETPDEDEESPEDSEEVKAEKKEKREKKAKKGEIEKALADNASAAEVLQKELDSLENKGNQVVEPVEGLGKLLKAQSEEISSLRKMNTDLRGELGEMSTKFDTISKSLTEVTELVGKIGDQSQGRKSIIPGTFIEKAFQEEEGTNKKMLSISGHKKEIRNLLMEESGISKGKKDVFYSDGLEFFEATGKLTDKVIVALFKDKDIKIVP